MIHASTNNAAAPKSQRGLDLYQTPAECTRALMDVEHLPRVLWEPAAGYGAMARVLEDGGHVVVRSDVEDYGNLHFVEDFLTHTHLPMNDVEGIVTNPPFMFAEEFAHKALYFCPRVWLLLRLGFIEGLRWEEGGLANHIRHVYIFSPRPPRMHMEGWEGNKASPTFTVAWFCFERNFNRTPTFSHIDPRRYRTFKTEKQNEDIRRGKA